MSAQYSSTRSAQGSQNKLVNKVCTIPNTQGSQNKLGNNAPKSKSFMFGRINWHNNNIANIPKFIIPNNTRRKYGNNTIEHNQHVIIINPIHNP